MKYCNFLKNDPEQNCAKFSKNEPRTSIGKSCKKWAGPKFAMLGEKKISWIHNLQQKWYGRQFEKFAKHDQE